MTYMTESNKIFQNIGNNIRPQTFPSSTLTSKEIDKCILEVNEKLQSIANRSMDINPFILLKDNIKNFRKLSDEEKIYLSNLSNEEKIEIILLYDQALSTTVELL